MFCVVQLKASKQNLVIKTNWIRDFKYLTFHNRGIKANKKHVIYYSVDEDDIADFDINISQVFQPGPPSLYEARLYMFYGKRRHFCFNFYVIKRLCFYKCYF